MSILTDCNKAASDPSDEDETVGTCKSLATVCGLDMVEKISGLVEGVITKTSRLTHISTPKLCI